MSVILRNFYFSLMKTFFFFLVTTSPEFFVLSWDVPLVLFNFFLPLNVELRVIKNNTHAPTIKWQFKKDWVKSTLMEVGMNNKNNFLVFFLKLIFVSSTSFSHILSSAEKRMNIMFFLGTSLVWINLLLPAGLQEKILNRSQKGNLIKFCKN